MSAEWVRCEADHVDGGVCMTHNPEGAECRNADQHGNYSPTSYDEWAEWLSKDPS